MPLPPRWKSGTEIRELAQPPIPVRAGPKQREIEQFGWPTTYDLVILWDCLYSGAKTEHDLPPGFTTSPSWVVKSATPPSSDHEVIDFFICLLAQTSEHEMVLKV